MYPRVFELFNPFLIGFKNKRIYLFFDNLSLDNYGLKFNPGPRDHLAPDGDRKYIIEGIKSQILVISHFVVCNLTQPVSIESTEYVLFEPTTPSNIYFL